MKTMRYTKHAQERLKRVPFLTEWDIKALIRSRIAGHRVWGETHVRLLNADRVYSMDGSTGDVLWAILDNDERGLRCVTLMWRMSTQKRPANDLRNFIEYDAI
jgi:hypothetical protein